MEDKKILKKNYKATVDRDREYLDKLRAGLLGMPTEPFSIARMAKLLIIYVAMTKNTYSVSNISKYPRTKLKAFFFDSTNYGYLLALESDAEAEIAALDLGSIALSVVINEDLQ